MVRRSLRQMRHAEIRDAHDGTDAAGQDVDRGASGQIVGDHLAGHRLRIRADARVRHAVIGREDGDHGGMTERLFRALDCRELAAEIQQTAEAPRRCREPILPPARPLGPGRVGRLDRRDGLGDGVGNHRHQIDTGLSSFRRTATN